jgi:recombination protein RecT
MTQTPLAKPEAKAQIKDLLQSERFRDQVALALPKAMSPERFVRIALTQTMKNPKLLLCTKDSFFKCLLELSAMGLEPDGRRAYLIPRKDKHNPNVLNCTFQIDYKGIAELVRRNGDVATIHSDVVREQDEFECTFGTGGRLYHKPALRERGEIYCVYSYVRLKDGAEEYDKMSIEEVEDVRRRSQTPNDGPWVTDYAEMCKKTIFRRLSKMLPISPEAREAIEHDDDREPLTEQERFAAAKTVTATVARGRGRPPKSTVETLDEPEPEMPLEAPETPPEHVSGLMQQQMPELSDEERKEALARAKLLPILEDLHGQTEFSLTELLDVLKEVRLAEKNFTALSEITAKNLKLIIDDWTNCVNRMAHVRKQKAETGGN